MSKFSRVLLTIAIYSTTAGLACQALAQAFFNPLAPPVLEDMQNQTNDVTHPTYNPATGPTSLLEMVAGVIRVFLGLLGTIFVVLIILAGYNWLTAAGEKGKVERAQTTMRTAIIGLVIITAAYAITYWIFARLPDSK